MDFTIREATLSDAPAIRELSEQELGYPYPLEATAQKLAALLASGRDKVFVAVLEEAVAGYVHASSYDVLYAPHMKNIMGIAVSADCRRHGIGRALLEQVELWAAHDGAAGIRLVSGSERLDAHAFYRRCGYSGDKQQINFKKKLRS